MFEEQYDRYETSVCGLHGLADGRLWEIGSEMRPDKNLIGAFEVAVSAVNNAGLSCQSAPVENYAEHGVIIGWKSEKSEQLSQAQDLVANCPPMRIPS